MVLQNKETLFWSRVTTAPDDKCWEHSGSVGSHGYPQATGFDGKSQPAHRLSWVLHHGPIADGLLILHRCNNKGCVRPDHLYLGTHKDNMDDVARVGHPRRKLSESEVLLIRSSSEPQRKLGARFGVSQRAVYAVRKGLTYRLVTGNP